MALFGDHANQTSVRLVVSWRRLGLDALLVTGPTLAALAREDVVLGRLDVLPGLDGVEPGLFDLLMHERRGARVLNPAGALLAAHDKLRTATLLRAAGVPQPRTGWVRTADDLLPVRAPLVVKPRFGSWGRDVERCATEEDARRLLRRIRSRSWFRRHGAIVQELVPPAGHDLRILVAGGRAIGAVERRAAPGEWRTNVSLGGTKTRADVGTEAETLALTAVGALACDLAAVDLLPTDDGLVVLEVNAAADFDDDYVHPGETCDKAIACALGLLPVVERPPTSRDRASQLEAGAAL